MGPREEIEAASGASAAEGSARVLAIDGDDEVSRRARHRRGDPLLMHLSD